MSNGPREPIPPPGPPRQMLEVVFVREGVSIASALPPDIQRVPVSAENTLQARSMVALPGHYLLTVTAPGQLTAEELAARQRQQASEFSPDERRAAEIERYWGSFPT